MTHRGLASGYSQAVEDLREAVEAGAVHRKCREALKLLEGRELGSVERWLEVSRELEAENGAFPSA